MSQATGRRRVVITGVGAITPLGQTVEEFWRNLVAGVSGVGPMTLCDTDGYPCKIAAEVKDWNPERFIDRKEARRMARFSQFAVAAAQQAIDQSGLDLDTEDRTGAGVLLGNGNGGYPNLEEAVRVIVERGGMRMDPFLMPKALPNMAAAQLSLQFGLKGYTSTTVTACAAGTQAIGEAAEVIRRGAAEIMLTGGTQAGICQLGLGAFAVMRAMSTRNDDPGMPAARSMPSATGLFPRKGRLFSCSNRSNTPRAGTHEFSPKSRATQQAQTPTTSSLPALTAKAPPARFAGLWPTPGFVPATSITSTLMGRRRRLTTSRKPSRSRLPSARMPTASQSARQISRIRTRAWWVGCARGRCLRQEHRNRRDTPDCQSGGSGSSL